MQLTLFSFSKRQNSTAVPSSGGAVVDVTLKTETSYNNPTFILSGNRPTGTYAQFEGAYYFIDDIRSVRANLWAIECTLDILGSYKTQIGATRAYVEYAQQGNNQIVDGRMGVEYGIANVTITTDQFSFASGQGGSYILAIVGKDTSDLYKVSRSTMRAIMALASQWTQNAVDMTDIVSAVGTAARQLLAMGSAPQNIKAAYWIPIDVSSIVGANTLLYLGEYETNAVGNQLTTPFIQETLTIAIPHQFNDWRRQSPYEEVYLHLPFYGTLKVPSDLSCDSASLKVTLICDAQSGDFTYAIGRGSSTSIDIVVGGNMRSDVLIGASNVSPSKTIGTLALATAGAVINPVAGFAGAAATIGTLQPLPQAAGGMGGSSNILSQLQCFVFGRNTSEAPGASAAQIGIPLFAQRQISSLSGYVKTRGASVSGNIRGALRDRINQMLDAGFFYE